MKERIEKNYLDLEMSRECQLMIFYYAGDSELRKY